MTVDWVNCVCFYSLGLEQVDLKRFATMNPMPDSHCSSTSRVTTILGEALLP